MQPGIGSFKYGGNIDVPGTMPERPLWRWIQIAVLSGSRECFNEVGEKISKGAKPILFKENRQRILIGIIPGSG